MLEQLQTKIAYLEQTTQALGEMVYRQQRELDALRARMAAFQHEVATLKSDAPGPPQAPADERPPHY